MRLVPSVCLFVCFGLTIFPKTEFLMDPGNLADVPMRSLPSVCLFVWLHGNCKQITEQILMKDSTPHLSPNNRELKEKALIIFKTR